MNAYISLVGFQSMAILSPLLTLLQHQRLSKSATVFLLPTKETLNDAEDIKGYLSGKYGGLTINIASVSTNLSDEEAPQKRVKQILQSLGNQKIYFNMAGGLKYLIVACILEIHSERVTYVYPEADSIRVFRFDQTGEPQMTEYEPVVERDFKTIFKIQGMEFRDEASVDTNQARMILNLLIDRDIADAETLFYKKAVRIGEVRFNYVFNSKNLLIFVYRTDVNTDTQTIRKIINLATNRHDFGELMHHKIIVITSSKQHKERLQSESGGKVIVLDPKDTKISIDLSVALKTNKYEIETFSTINSPSLKKSLYVVLGREIMPTLTAIWSHMPDRICFLYTPTDNTVMESKKSIIENRALLPTKEIIFIPTDITGKEILSYKPGPNEVIECNITPGTKAQGAFLTLFAKMHGGTVWSINQKNEGSIEQLPTGIKKPLNLPDVLTITKLKGLFTEGMMADRVFDEAGMELLLKFLCKLKEKPFFHRFPEKDIDLDGFIYRVFKDSRYGELKVGKQFVRINLDMNPWFEDLTAWSLKKAGVKDLVLRLKRQIQDSSKEEYIVRTEIDVIGIYRGRYLVISCKSGKFPSKYTEINNQSAKTQQYYDEKFMQLKREAISDLKGTVALLGRFAVPLLSAFRHRGDPQMIDEVYVFGIDTLCDSKKIQNLLDMAIKARQTT